MTPTIKQQQALIDKLAEKHYEVRPYGTVKCYIDHGCTVRVESHKWDAMTDEERGAYLKESLDNHENIVNGCYYGETIDTSSDAEFTIVDWEKVYDEDDD